MELNEAMKAFDLAFMFTDQDLNITQLLLLVKARFLFWPHSESYFISSTGCCTFQFKSTRGGITTHPWASYCLYEHWYFCLLCCRGKYNGFDSTVYWSDFWLIRHIYITNWGSMHWMVGVTMKLLTTSLLPSTPAFYHLNWPSVPDMTSSG